MQEKWWNTIHQKQRLWFYLAAPVGLKSNIEGVAFIKKKKKKGKCSPKLKLNQLDFISRAGKTATMA